MRARGGRRQIFALLLLAPLVVASSTLLELAKVARLATERAAVECDLITDSVRRQLDLLAREHPSDDLETLARDPRLQLVLGDAVVHAASILHLAVCDPDGIVVAHSMSTRVGEPVARGLPLPVAEDLPESFRALWELRRSEQVYERFTSLTTDGNPFASIQVLVSGAFLRDGIRQAFWTGVAVSLVVLTVAIGAGALVTRLALGRLRVLEEGVAALRQGRFEAAIPETGADEFGRIARELKLLGEQFQRERRESGAGRTLWRAADLLGDGIVAVGASDEVILVNASACGVLGLDGGGAVGRRLSDLLPAGHPVQVLCRQLRAGSERSLSIPLREDGGGDGSLAVGHRIEDAEGSDPGILIELKPARDQAVLHSLVDQSRVLTRLGEMATGVAHELRDPLQTLSLDLDAVATAAAREPELEPYVRSARQKVARLDRAIRGFLTIARMRPPAFERVDINVLLAQLREEMEPDANLAGLELDLDLGPGEAPIDGDVLALRQAIQNVVRNSILALPSRHGRIVLRSRRDRDRISVSVTDSGPGIPPEALDKVFDLFYTTREEGTGVGLALVRQAVEMHGGEVVIRSEPGSGTVVTLSLPLGTGDGR
jgi:signal transduction histidine kinase